MEAENDEVYQMSRSEVKKIKINKEDHAFLHRLESVLPGGRNPGQISQKGPEKNVVGREKLWPNFSRFLSKVAEKGLENCLKKKLLYFEKKEGLILYHLMNLFRKYLFQQERNRKICLSLLQLL